MKSEGRLYVRGNQWWMAFRASVMTHGKIRRIEVRETTHVPVTSPHSEKAAWGVLKARLKQVNRPEWVGPYNERLTVSDILDAYQTLRGPVVRNAGAMKYAITHLKDEFGVTRCNALLPEQVDAWRTKMVTVGYSQGTVDRIARVLRAAFNLALRDRKVAFVPRISTYNPEDARQGFMEPPEFEAIEKALREIEPDIADMWVFAYYSGRRPGELQELQWSAVSLESREARITRSKNRKPWTISLEGPLWDCLQARLAASRFHEVLSPYVFHRGGKHIDSSARNRAFRQARVAAGYPARLWYDCRRSCARDMIAAGVDPSTVMQALGHTTRAMLDRYNIVSPDQQRDAVRRLVEARQGNRAQNRAQNVVPLNKINRNNVPR